MSQPINIYECPARDEHGYLPIAYMVAVMQKAADGAPVQIKDSSAAQRMCPHLVNWTVTQVAAWEWHSYDYRVDPASAPKAAPKPKVKRPMVGAEYPAVFWVRDIRKLGDPATGPRLATAVLITTVYDDGRLSLIHRKDNDGANTGPVVHSTWQPTDIMTAFEYSVNRVNWKPCYIETEVTICP